MRVEPISIIPGTDTICPLLSIPTALVKGTLTECVKDNCQWWAKCQTLWDVLADVKGEGE